MTKRTLAGAVLLLVVGYMSIGFRNLGVVPPVHEDEPWQASTGWKLADELSDPTYGRIEIYRRRP